MPVFSKKQKNIELLYNYFQENGYSARPITIQKKLGLSTASYDRAVRWLRENNLWEGSRSKFEGKK